MTTVLRQVERYGLYSQEANHYANRFAKLLAKDAYSENGSYRVRTLYFDTVHDHDFFNMVDDHHLQRKIRLRIYDPRDQTAHLELNEKQGDFQKKRRLTVSQADALALIEGNTSVLLNYPGDLADEFYALMSMGGYRPKTIVEYQRQAFVTKEKNVRLTFDHQIRGTESSFALFDADLLLDPIVAENYVVFEVKYERFMQSYLSDIISEIDRRQMSANKYCMGRSIGYPDYL